MDFKFNSNDPDLRAQIQLLKSHIERKSALSYEINQMNIKSNLKNSSSSRDQKELLQLNKMLGRRLTEMRLIQEKFRNVSLKEITKENLDKIFENISEVEPKVDLPRDVFSLNFEIETYVHSLKDYYLQISESYTNKQQELEGNAKRAEGFESLIATAEEFEREAGDFLLEIKSYKNEIERLKQLKNKIATKRRGSVEKVKGFQFLSNSAIQLKSKYLLKNELVVSLSNAEKELDLSNENIQQKQAKIKEIELEQQFYLKNSAKFEAELSGHTKQVKKLEKRLENLNAEKKELVDRISLTRSFQVLYPRRLSLPLVAGNTPKGENKLKEVFSSFIKGTS